VPEYELLLNELSNLCGIIPEYCDTFGVCHEAPPGTKKAILNAMGLRTETVDSLVMEISKKQRQKWNTFLSPVMVILVTEQPADITLHIPVRQGDENSISFQCALSDEDGHRDLFSFGYDEIEILERETIDEVPHMKIAITLDVIKKMGYYDLDVLYISAGFGMAGYAKLIIAPESCYIPDHFESLEIDDEGYPQRREKSRIWGLCLNLYAISSERNWGIGDFTDLTAIGEWAAGLGSGFIGINPLHCIPNRQPAGVSPYSPLSRLYKNFAYLDIESIPEVLASGEAHAIIQWASLQKIITSLRASETVDYEKISAIKAEVLQRAFEYFYDHHYLNNTPRASDFRRYASSEAQILDDFALYSALRQKMKDEKKSGSWREWTQEFRDIKSEQLKGFMEENEKNILFYKYVQWVIEEQHEEVCKRFRQLGMPVGLYQDLAVGSSDDGFDAWYARDLIAGGIDVGAPPDDFNLPGQNWGFPPMIPEKMTSSGYDFLIQTIRKNMRHAGALRIDHALGMFRQFWIPGGTNPVDGAYVQYPSEDMLRIIALESARNSTIVIAEDLGSVGEDVRETLLRFRMLSYKLLCFERNYPAPSFRIPERYSDLALSSVTTHDLPTLYGYWASRDIEAKTSLGLYTNEELRLRQIAERERDKKLLLQALKAEDLLPDSFDTDPSSIQQMISTLCLTIYEYLARTPSKLLAVSLDDFIGTLDQQNMPGTVDSYPNWIQKMPASIEKIMTDRSFLTLSKILKKNHR
jgi:4-alpha-glucanotransferase